MSHAVSIYCLTNIDNKTNQYRVPHIAYISTYVNPYICGEETSLSQL
jgi:hypothetical protein